MIKQHFKDSPPQVRNVIQYFRTAIFEPLSELAVIPYDIWVSGGCVRDMFTTGKISNDIDLFFSSRSDFQHVFNVLVDNDCKLIYENDNAARFIFNHFKLDLVKRHFDSPEETIQSFDFTVSCAAINYHRFISHETFFMDLSKKQLIIVDLPHPLSTMRRIIKYISQKGYRICNQELLKVMVAISKLDLDFDTREGQELLEMSNLFDTYPDGSPKFVGID